MCTSTREIKLCTCKGDKIKYRKLEQYKKVNGELVPLPNKKNDNIPVMYIWNLFRYVGKEENCMIGEYMFPTEDIGNGLNAKWIASNLNAKNCFDFEYIPSYGDNLIITQNIELAPYISFIFKNGKWITEHYDPFTEITKQINEGKIIEIEMKKLNYKPA